MMSTNSCKPKHYDHIDPWNENRIVSISEFSEMCFYNPGTSRHRMSYSSKDVADFKHQTSIEASRLSSFLSRQSEPGVLPEYERVVGIESLVIGNGNVAEERKSHITSVLRVQKRLKEDSLGDVAIKKLAKVAYVSSLRSSEKARLRALMSLEADQPGSSKLAPTINTTSLCATWKAKIRAAYAA